MIVYVAEVAVDEYEPTHFVGVYSSEDLAAKAIQRLSMMTLAVSGYGYQCSFFIQRQCEVDKNA